jgi:hypothetical protein
MGGGNEYFNLSCRWNESNGGNNGSYEFIVTKMERHFGLATVRVGLSPKARPLEYAVLFYRVAPATLIIIFTRLYEMPSLCQETCSI